MSEGYYFVSFGREPGGLLDFLGLPPDAPEGKVGAKTTTYMKKINQELGEAKQALKVREGNGEITPEELAAGVEKASQERTTKLVSLNELMSAYEAEKAQRRGLAGARQALAGGGWREMYRSFSPDSLWEELLKHRPLERFEADLVLQMRQKLLAFSGAGDAGAFPGLASSPYRPGQRVDLSTVCGLAAERDLLHLLAADLLWEQLRFTNREYWRAQVERWGVEVEDLGPKLGHDASAKPGGVDTWEYPRLCGLKTQMIDKLQAGKTPDFAQGPARPNRMPETIDLQKFLELLAGLEGRSSAAAPGGSELPVGSLGKKTLLDLLLEGMEEEMQGGKQVQRKGDSP